jgi:hypothetical protein
MERELVSRPACPERLHKAPHMMQIASCNAVHPFRPDQVPLERELAQSTVWRLVARSAWQLQHAHVHKTLMSAKQGRALAKHCRKLARAPCSSRCSWGHARDFDM